MIEDIRLRRIDPGVAEVAFGARGVHHRRQATGAFILEVMR
ncbi:MAG: hypothetical protein SV775_08405 [Thermodesulfobacteriota bacterium]|nr:hypothetical protein [Thermodesulfobacteriota bacterium]